MATNNLANGTNYDTTTAKDIHVALNESASTNKGINVVLNENSSTNTEISILLETSNFVTITQSDNVNEKDSTTISSLGDIPTNKNTRTSDNTKPVKSITPRVNIDSSFSSAPRVTKRGNVFNDLLTLLITGFFLTVL